MTRRVWIAAVAALASRAPLVAGVGESAAAEEPGTKLTILFVQNARSLTFQNGKLTLKGVSPATVFFSDRPQRIAGHMDTKEFVPFWSEGRNSFLSDPPNATLSIFGEGTVTNVVVVLRNPELKGDELSYDVRVLQGEMPDKGDLASLFIDIIGMPLTPLSYAGAGRRMYRRAVVY